MVKKLVAGVLMGAMLFSLTGCGEKVKKYSAEEYQEIVADTLGIDEDEIYIRETDQDLMPSLFTGTEIFFSGHDYHIFFDAIISEDDFAQVTFERNYDMAQAIIETDQFKAVFEGDYNIAYDGEEGYIVFSGGPILTGVFGDINSRSTDFYGGCYYNDNVLVRVCTNETNGSGEEIDDVINIIEALGYPTVEDK